MLSQLETESPAAPDAPVTARELAEAVTSLEMKKAGLSGRPQTIRLDDAIRQLNIEATPQELIAEIEVLRTARYQRQRAGHRSRRQAGMVATLTALLGLFVAIEWWEDRQNAAPVSPITSPSPLQTISQSESYLFLRNVPVGRPVGAEYSTIAELAAGKSVGHLRADARISESTLGVDGKLWLLEKTGTGFQVHVWAEPSEALKAANGRESLVYPNPLPGGTVFGLVPLKLDIRRFRGGDDMLFNPAGGAYTAVRLKSGTPDSVPSF